MAHESITTDSRLDPEIVEQAIDWMVKLESGQALQSDREACARWRSQHPDHEGAWIQLEAISARIKTLPSTIAHTTFAEAKTKRPTYSRRFVLKSMVLIGGVGTLTLATRYGSLWPNLLADHHTAIGEQQQIKLLDGTQVMLNTNTTLDTHLAGARRTIELHYGEVFIITAKDSASGYQPLVVRTKQGHIRALGTQFLVRQHAKQTQIAVFEGAVEVRNQAGVVKHLPTDRQLQFTSTNMGAATAANRVSTAWTQGVLVAKNRRLGEFLEELGRYRSGYLRCDDRAAELRISGVFPLNDTDRILRALESTLPVTVRYRTPYWVMITHL